MMALKFLIPIMPRLETEKVPPYKKKFVNFNNGNMMQLSAVNHSVLLRGKWYV